MKPIFEVDESKIGKYGILFHDFLKKEYPNRYTELYFDGELFSLCREVNKEAYDTYNNLINKINKKSNKNEKIYQDIEKIILQKIVLKLK